MQKGIWYLAFGLVGGLLGAGLLFLMTRQPAGQAITLLPPPTPAPLVVHVTGAVLQPGVYSLPTGSRVRDAVEAAGGLSQDAAEGTINLAAFLEDGARVFIPSLTPTPRATSTRMPEKSQSLVIPSATEEVTLTPSFPININTATLEELDVLPGIGPVTAQKIITYRETNGPFARIEDIQNVPGIGPATYAKIKDLITVGNNP